MSTRTLDYIPIVHTHADLGGLGEQVRQRVLREEGLRGWQRRTQAVEQLWDRIERAVTKPRARAEKVRVYQDGLPVCGREKEIVQEMARKGSRNHKLLLRLMEQGASIMGTESAELLAREVEMARLGLAANPSGSPAAAQVGGQSMEADLLEKRDAYIADRINKTLQQGEAGILFIGMLHSMAARLDKDIRVSYPVDRPAKL